MLGCKFEINLSGTTKSFNSQQELDDFVSKNYKRIKLASTGFEGIRFSKDTDFKADNTALIKSLKAEGAAVVSYDIEGVKVEVINNKLKPGYKGVTPTINALEHGGRYVFTPFDKENFISVATERLKKQFIEENPTISENLALTKAQEEVNKIVSTWPLMSEMGTEIHNVAAIYFENLHVTKQNLRDVYVQSLEGKSPKLHPLVIDSLWDIFSQTRKEIERISNDTNLTFSTEVPVYDDASKLVGIIDLVAVDSKGNAYIADFKTSYKNTSEWDRDKISRYKYQMAFYKRLLESKGIPVLDELIIPIKLESTDEKYKTVESISTDEIQSLGVYLTSPSTVEYQTARNFIEAKELEILSIETSGIIEKEQKEFFNTSSDEALSVQYEYFIDPVRGMLRTENGVKFFINSNNKKTYLKPINPNPETKEEIEQNSINEFENKQTIMSHIVQSNESKYENILALKRSIRNSIKEGLTLQESSHYSRKDFRNPFGSHFDSEVNKNVENTFSHYLNGAWEVQDIADLESHGIITFKNTVSNYLDFIIITNEDIFAIHKLSKGKNITGEFLTDNERLKSDTNMDANVSNLGAMKVLSVLNNNVDLFEKQNLTVNSIRSFNYEKAQQMEIQKDKLIANYNILTLKTGLTNNLKRLKFTSAAQELLSSINAALRRDQISGNEKKLLETLNGIIAVQNPDTVKLVSELVKVKKEFEFKHKQDPKKGIDFNSDLGLVYGFLNDMIAELSGSTPPVEINDMKKVSLYDSTQFSSFHEIQNKVVRTALMPLRSAMNIMANNYVKFDNEMRPVFKEFYEAKGVSRVLGNYQQSFSNLFVKDEGGNLIKEFKFKDPDARPNDLTYLDAAERKFLRKILPVIAERLYGDQKLKEAKVTGDYFNVPLVRAGFTSKVIERGFGVVGNIKSAFVNLANESLEEVFLFDEQVAESRKRSADMTEMFNKHDINKSPIKRKEIITSKGGDLLDFEKNVELILADLVFTDMKVTAYNNTLPIVSSVIVTSMMQTQKFGNFNLENAYSYIRDSVKTTVFDEKLIEDHNRKLASSLGSVKHAVSMLQLGAAPLNLVREILQGMWTNISKLAAKQYGEGTPSMSDYFWAVKQVVGEGPEFYRQVTLTEGLNNLYRMANMDTHLMAEKMVVSKTGLWQLSNRWWLWFMGAPDYINRMTFLLAKMRKDGSYDAHTLVGEEVVYDWTKDERFSEYAAGNTSSPEYEKQRGLYLAYLDEFNKDYTRTGEGSPLVEGDALPVAYPTAERESMKSFVNYMHGPYDHEDKILFHNTLFGVMMMQFKTWLMAKKMQYFMKGGTYSVGQMVHKKEEGTGLPLYIHWAENGDRYIDTNPEGGTPYNTWEGKYMEGVWNSFVRVGKELVSGKMTDAWNLMKTDSTIKSNLAMTAMDLGFFLMVAMSVWGIIEWAELEKDDKLAMAFMNTIKRSSEDLYIINNLEALTNPESMFPAVSYTWDTMADLFDVMTGDKDMRRFVARSTAFTRTIDQTTNLFEESK